MVRGVAALMAVIAWVVVDGRPACAAASPAMLASAEARLQATFAARGVPYPPSGVTLVALKQEGRLELWAGGATSRRFVRSYLIRAASGRLGPKLRQGDRQVPEGIYGLDLLNPDSQYHLSMRLDYPNGFDRARAREDGRNLLGGDIMIHGDRVSAGCLPVGDAAIEELYALVSRIGLDAVGVIVSPLDLRRIPLSVALARAGARPAWLRDLYAEIARTLAAFPVSTEAEPTPAPRGRLLVASSRCKAHDAADCARRCLGGDMPSCARAGLLHVEGWGVPADANRAWQFLTRACDGGSALGCAELSTLLVDDDGLRRDVRRAAELARAACDAGDGHGCYALAELCADRVLYPGDRAECSEGQTRRLYARAVATLHTDCSGWGASDCHTLAAIYADDDPDTALRFAAGSCREGNPLGCADLRRLRP